MGNERGMGGMLDVRRVAVRLFIGGCFPGALGEFIVL